MPFLPSTCHDLRAHPEDFTQYCLSLAVTRRGSRLLGPRRRQSAKQFPLVAVDSFTKWIEAEPLSVITRPASAEVHLASHLSVRSPSEHHHRQRSPLHPHAIRDYLTVWALSMSRSSVGHPHTNGQPRAAISHFAELQKRLGEATSLWWMSYPRSCGHTDVPPHGSTGNTPSNLTYGPDASFQSMWRCLH
ncbi:uncharacterized protein LOC124828134 [Vigna umbellata]|uniref:uncharacterized protein LOC124828134 n=1 Tax=Vigna umbellata TaxID=87088 RepID=UPI001F5F9D18|nr:uncharacterized protein LOC124828134 [Vigna umbellata]